MIEWMQKHKKWLIVTIWISTIAFVGAGFVGWGSYDYGKSNSTVAIVGNEEVPLKDLQNEYSSLYSQYQRMLGDNFNQELAKQFKLEDAALQRVIQKYLILNYANDLGLMSTDKEVAQELVKINAFFKDGKFDKQTYIRVLKQNKRTASEFEAQLKQDILVSKVQKLFQTSLKENEFKNMSSLLFSEDEVSLKILNDDHINITILQKDLDTYWNTHKENYKSPSGFEIAYTKIENIENKTKKEMKKVALRTYLNLKKENEKFSSTKTLYTSSTFLNPDDLVKITKSTEETVLKPMYKDGNYYVIKLMKKISPQVLAYEKVKEEIRSDYQAEQKIALMEKQAQKIVQNFSGINLGYIGRNNIPKIKGLSDEEKDKFIKDLFGATKKINTLNLGSKILIYKITNSKFATYDTAQDKTVTQTIGNLKSSSLSSAFLAKLATNYEVQSFMGNN